MADFATAWSPDLGFGDWLFLPPTAEAITDENGAAIVDIGGDAITDGLLIGAHGIVVGNDLGTAILISLFTDAEAGTDDVMPDRSGDPRGWWGDLGADRPIGSKIWLRSRSRQDDTVLALVKHDIASALQWLVDDQVAASVDVTAEWAARGFLAARVIVTRPDGQKQSLAFDWAWKEVA